MQFFTIFSFFTDGFSYAGEALTGKYIGAREEENMKNAIKALFTWGIVISFSFTLIYTLFSQNLLQLLTNDHEILQCAPQYTIWIIAIPLCSFSAFLWDGIMIGATMTKGMVVSMVCATLIFFATYTIFIGSIGNHGLWLAFVLYLMTRGLSQSIYFKHKIKQLFPTL
jgi:MATE family multidrug resistance protein